MCRKCKDVPFGQPVQPKNRAWLSKTARSPEITAASSTLWASSTKSRRASSASRARNKTQHMSCVLRNSLTYCRGTTLLCPYLDWLGFSMHHNPKAFSLHRWSCGSASDLIMVPPLLVRFMHNPLLTMVFRDSLRRWLCCSL